MALSRSETDPETALVWGLAALILAKAVGAAAQHRPGRIDDGFKWSISWGSAIAGQQPVSRGRLAAGSP